MDCSSAGKLTARLRNPYSWLEETREVDTVVVENGTLPVVDDAVELPPGLVLFLDKVVFMPVACKTGVVVQKCGKLWSPTIAVLGLGGCRARCCERQVRMGPDSSNGLEISAGAVLAVLCTSLWTRRDKLGRLANSGGASDSVHRAVRFP